MPFAASSRALLVAFPVLLFAACSSAALPDVAPDAAQDAAGGDGAADAPDAALPADAASADATLAEGGPASDAAVSDAGASPDASVLDAAAPPDASTPDASTADAALFDAAPLDAATVDAGPVCGGGTRLCSGACVDVTTDIRHCGGCDRACVFPGGAAACRAGVCALAGCDRGRADCDGLAVNGCEVDTDNSDVHCGRCGVACGAGRRCVLGTCL